MNKNKIQVRLFLLLIPIIMAGCPSPADSGTGDTEEETTQSSEKSITGFSLLQTDNASLSEDIACDIDSLSITGTLPYGIATTLVPAITVSENATVSPASGTAQDFSSDVEYVITAEDGSTQTYTVTLDQYSESEVTDSSLSGLTMYRSDGFNLRLDFESSTTTYEVNTTSSVESIRFRLYTASSLSTYNADIEGTTPVEVSSYGYTDYIDLAEGLNTINLTITSFDGSSTTDYVIKVTRGADLTVSVGEGWTAGTLTDEQELTDGSFLWYTFAAEVGKYYQIAIDGDNDSTTSDCWTPDNGGWEDLSGYDPNADPYYNVYREDGTTLYDTPEQDESTYTINGISYTGYMRGDYKYYVTIQALDETVKIKMTQHEYSDSSAHSFAIQVKERTSFPDPVEVSTEGEWFETSVADVTDLWTYYDVPTYLFSMAEGVRYRVGIDDGTDTWDDDGGWNTAGCGISTEPTASKVKMQLLTPDGENYDYEEGDSGWVDTDQEGDGDDRRFATITALDSEVYMQVDPSSSGTFAIQYRPVLRSVTEISPSTEWLDVVQTDPPGYWEQEWHYTFPVEAGKTYRMGVDDRGEYSTGVNWTTENGGSLNVDASYLVYRILKSDGTTAEFKEDWREEYYDDGWYRADQNDTAPPSYDQMRYLTFTAEEDADMSMEIKNVIYFVSGTFAIQLRELPEPTEIPVDEAWHDLVFAQEGDTWDMGNYSAISFSTENGTTYYVDVDTSAANIYQVDAPGPYRTTQEYLYSDDYIEVVADNDNETVYLWTYDGSGESDLAYKIKISTTEPTTD